jgi:tetratricopeptide (TPR) repeat protein
MDLFVERTNESMEAHDLKRSLSSVQQAMDRLDDRSESNPDHILLSILKAKVYAHFQRLEEAQATLLNTTGIPSGDVLIIIAAHDSTANTDLRKLAGRMLKYPDMKDRFGPHVALALVYNILRDSVAMRAQQKLVMDRADPAARSWIPKLTLTLYGLQADKVQAYGRLAYAKEEMARDGVTRENQLDLAAFLTDLGRFKEATPIVDKYLALDPKDLDFLIVRVNIAMGSGDLPQMEKYRAQALSIDPHALDE